MSKTLDFGGCSKWIQKWVLFSDRPLRTQTALYIIQQTRAMPIYGQKAIVIRHPYITDILRYTLVAKIRP